MATIKVKGPGYRVRISGRAVAKPQTPAPPPTVLTISIGAAFGWLFMGLMIAAILFRML